MPLAGYTPSVPGIDKDDDDESPDNRQAWEKEWTILSQTSLVETDDEIVEVKLTVPGRVFFSTSSNQAPLGKVRFSGNSADVLDLFEVVSTGGNGVIEIRQRPNAQRSKFDGYLLVEVTFSHANKLLRLTSKGSADVVVEPNVFVSQAPKEQLEITLQGSGNVFVHDAPALEVQEFALVVVGRGNIEFSTTQIEAKDVFATLGGSGDIRLFANALIASDTTTLALAGSGDIYLNSYNLSSHKVHTVVAGSGDISVYPAGKCVVEDVTIAGSGDVFLGSIVAETVSVSIGGSGDAIVQATKSLSGGVVGSGDVEYFGTAPLVIAPKSTFFSGSKDPKPMAKATDHNKFHEAKLSELPMRVPVHLSINTAPLDDTVTDRSVLVPLVLVALLAAWYIHYEHKKQNAKRLENNLLKQQEMQPLTTTQAQVYV
uniref:Putative auto-transporter adhesin head GIN domain-containing protein n=1 Tax=Globisporangium ultimum (strain ATCC 200006 / CBS 805.95 / DAOM BR144) TaxID=431595 RepID=K3X9G1_GLOUD